MGQPTGSSSSTSIEELTWGSETSQYPEEKKSNETPKVAASEMGRGQTVQFRLCGVVGPPYVISE